MTIGPRLVFRIDRRDRADAEQAFEAADDGADPAADDRADRPGDAVAFLNAMHKAVGNALRLRRGERQSQRCDDDCCERDVRFHATTLSLW